MLFKSISKFEIIILSIILLSLTAFFCLRHSVQTKYCYTTNGQFITKIQKYLFEDWSVVDENGRNYKNMNFLHASEKNNVVVYHPIFLNNGSTQYEMFKINTETFEGVYLKGSFNINYDKLNSAKLSIRCADTFGSNKPFAIG